MLNVRRLPSALVPSTFVLCGLLATTGTVSVVTGVGQAETPQCPGIDPDRPARGILDCLAPSIAFIETALGTGSGVLLADGYVLTNAHVVDPVEQVHVTIDGSAHEDVPVIGVDLFADIAVLGPLDVDRPGVTLVDPAHLESGDQLFLVGYPGEANAEDLEPTIATGILSRTRTNRTFDLTYLQTDASIGGGQSGGALVDAHGQVVGISGLRFAERFALALSSVDAQAAVDEILGGEGEPYQHWATGDATTDLSLTLGPWDPATLTVPMADDERTVEITTPADLPVIVFTISMASQRELEVAGNYLAVATELGMPRELLGVIDGEEFAAVVDMGIVDGGSSPAAQVAPGTFRFRIPAGEPVLLGVLTTREAGLHLPLRSSVPLVHRAAAPPVAVQVGDGIDGILWAVNPSATFHLSLDAGQVVELYASSPASDLLLIVQPPGDADPVFLDDSRAGLYGLDVEERYTADVGGLHTIEIASYDVHGTGYRFEVRPG